MAEGADGLFALLLVGGLLYGLAKLAGRRRSRRRRRRSRRGRSRWSWLRLQSARTIRTRRGLLVRSHAERRVAELLDHLGIAYEYEPMMYGWYPDFYVPRWNLVIEYWGMDPPGSPKRRAKAATYRRHRHRRIDLEAEDSPRLEDVLLRKLYAFDQDVYRRARLAPADEGG